MPPRAYRDPTTGIRVPPCTTRVLSCSTRAKWCGESVISVVQNEFSELGRADVLQAVLANGLLQVNGRSLTLNEAYDVQLKSSDKIARVVHWHEAPVCVPERIEVTKVSLPEVAIKEYGLENSTAAFVYVCNKPASVPVHRAGPYFGNSLIVMVEAQEQLEPLTLNPVHRVDRVTSGLTLCCTDSTVARLFHKSLSEGNVQKMYLARVSGKFPSSTENAESSLRKSTRDATWTWLDSQKVVQLDAPVHTIDAANGVRTVSSKGKPSQSLFQLLTYDASTDTSVLSCCPVTGRNHQLRVHLQWLGFPIAGDVQYGSRMYDSSQHNMSEKALDLMVNMANASVESRKFSGSRVVIPGLNQNPGTCVSRMRQSGGAFSSIGS
jgi:tRNA pseudouridine32 synthase